MDKQQKLEMIKRFNEQELTKKFLIPLYESTGMGTMSVRYTHRKLEFGKDIVYYKDDENGKRTYTAVQVKKIRITTSDVDTINRQINEAFGEPFTDLVDLKKKEIDRVVILTSNEFLEEAKDSLLACLHGTKLDRVVTCIDGNQLVALLEKHLPSAFWAEYDYFTRYFEAMKADFQTIKDVSAIGQKEPIPLGDIYISLRGSEKLPERELPISRDGKIFEEELIREKSQWAKKEQWVLDVERAVKDYDRLVIVGVPGSGKTTLMKHLALSSCIENIQKEERKCVPIPIALREFSDSEKSLRVWIDIVFEKYQFPKAKRFIEKDLKEGKCQLLLDGFDELATEPRQGAVAKRIHEFIDVYPRAQVIVTSRIAGYHDELKGFTTLKLMEFDDNQIERFIDNWFGKTDPEKAKSILSAIDKNEQIKTLARNPLMITIIAIIYEEDRELPQRRAALYERCIDVLLSKLDVQKRLKNEYDSERKEFILKKLAFYGHINNKRVLTGKEVEDEMLKYFPQLDLKEKDAKQFLNEIWQRSYLLRQISKDRYDFLHLSFQEYFTALELKEQKDGISIIIQHLTEPWWQEPTVLYAGISKNATWLVRRINQEVKEDMFYSNLLLSGKCIADAPFTELALKKEIINNLWSLHQTAQFLSLKQSAIKVLGLIKPDHIIDSQIKNLTNIAGKNRERAAEALGYLGSEKAVEPLINALTIDKDSGIRESAAKALGYLGSKKAVEPLIKALTTNKEITIEDMYFQAEAIMALGSLGDEKAIEPLTKAATDKTDKHLISRRVATWALASIGGEKTIEPLINILATIEDDDIQRDVRRALRSLGGQKVHELLIKALTTDKDRFVQRNATWALRSLGGQKVHELLIKAVTTDKDRFVQRNATWALRSLGSQKVHRLLIKAQMTNQADSVLWSAVMTLWSLGSEETIEPLIKILTTAKDEGIRGLAAEALGSLGSDKPISPLIKALAKSYTYVRWNAAGALGILGSEKAIDPLIKALVNDANAVVRERAATALENLGSDKAIEPLIKALTTDVDDEVRMRAMSALGSLGSEKAVEPLVKALTTAKGSWIRTSAAEALGSLGSEKAIEPLKKVLRDEKDWFVKDAAFISLRKISQRTRKRYYLPNSPILSNLRSFRELPEGPPTLPS